VSSSKLVLLKEAINVLNLKSNVSRLISPNGESSLWMQTLYIWMLSSATWLLSLFTILTCSRFVLQLLQYLRSSVFNCERREQGHRNSLNSWTVVMMTDNLVRSQGIWAFHKTSNNLRSDSLFIPSWASQQHTEQGDELRMQQSNHQYKLMWSHKSEVTVSAARLFWSVTLSVTSSVLQTYSFLSSAQSLFSFSALKLGNIFSFIIIVH